MPEVKILISVVARMQLDYDQLGVRRYGFDLPPNWIQICKFKRLVNFRYPINRFDRGTVRSSNPGSDLIIWIRPFEDGRSRVLTPTRESQARTASGSFRPSKKSKIPAPKLELRLRYTRSEQIGTQYSQPDIRSSQMPQTQSPRVEVRPSQTQRNQASATLGTICNTARVNPPLEKVRTNTPRLLPISSPCKHSLRVHKHSGPSRVDFTRQN